MKNTKEKVQHERSFFAHPSTTSPTGVLYKVKEDDGQSWRGYTTQKPDVRVPRASVERFQSTVQVEVKPVAHPGLPYQASRGFREDVHEALSWTKAYPLDVIDRELGATVMEVADDDEMVRVRQFANALGKRVNRLGYKGSLEVLARIGAILNSED